MEIQGQEIEEVMSVKRITIEYGQKSNIIKREGDNHFIVFSVTGHGVILPVDQQSGGHMLSYNTVARLDFREGDEFVIVNNHCEEEFSVVIMEIVSTTTLKQAATG